MLRVDKIDKNADPDARKVGYNGHDFLVLELLDDWREVHGAPMSKYMFYALN